MQRSRTQILDDMVETTHSMDATCDDLIHKLNFGYFFTRVIVPTSLGGMILAVALTAVINYGGQVIGCLF